MGYAKHVGRIGALAVALGVGIGLGNGPAIAHADDTTNSTDSPTTSSSPDNDRNIAPTAGHADDVGQREKENADDSPDLSASEHDEDDSQAVDAHAEKSPEPEPDDGEVADGRPSDGSDEAVVRTKRSPRQHSAWRTTLRPAVTTPPRTIAAPTPARMEVSGDTARPASLQPPSAPLTPDVLSAPTPTSLTLTTLSPAPAAEPPTDTATVSLSTLLAPMFGTGGTGAPVETPALWLLLAAARRQLGSSGRRVAAQSAGLTSVAAAANTNPVAAKPIINPPNASGVVTGSVSVTDADGDPLTYALSKPANGSVTATRTNGVFAFTYTPTETARHAAADTTAADSAKRDSFTLTVSDGRGGSVAVPITVAIKPANAEPTASARSRPGLFTSTVRGAIRAKDSDRDTLTYTASPTAKGGTVSVTTRGSFIYKPSDAARHAASSATASAADRTDTFVVTVADGHGGVAAVTVAVPIKPANSRPTDVKAANLFTNPNSGEVTGTITATDPDGDGFTYQAPVATGDGAVTINSDGTFTYTPTIEARTAASKQYVPFWDKTDSFKVTLDDGHGGTSTMTVRVDIAPLGHVNQAPSGPNVVVGTPDSTTGKVAGSITVTDAEHDVLTFTGPGATGKGSVVVDANGQFIFTPTSAARHQATATNATAADKDYSFDVTITDGYGGSLTVPVTVPISPSTNTAPASGTFTSSTDTNGKVTGTATATDADNDSLSYSGTITTGKGSAVVNPNGTFTYTPTTAARHNASAADATAADKQDTFTITVTDNHGGTTTIPVTLTILGKNAAPAGGTFTSSTDTNGKVTGTATATDPENDTLTYSGTITTGKGSAVVNPNGTFTYTPTTAARHNASAADATAADKQDTFTITVTDNHGGTTTIPVTLTILGKNAAPAGGTFTSSTDTNGKVTGTATATDPENDTLSYSGTITTGKGSAVVNPNGTFTYTPTTAARHNASAADATAADKQDTFTITVTDNHGGTTTIPVTLTILGKNAAPAGGTFTSSTDTNGKVTGTATATDADNDSLSYSGTITTGKGSAVVNPNGTFTYTPTTAARHNASAADATAADKQDTFTITVTDNHGGTTTIPVTLTILGKNAAPAGGTFTSSTDTNGKVTGTATATDADNDSLSYSGTITTGKGSAVVNPNGTFTYTPTTAARHNASAADATAADKQDTFTITVTDNHGGTTTIPVTLTILGKNAAPAGGTFTSSTDTNGKVTGTATATDADNDSLSYSGTITTGKGSAVVNPNGTFTYTPTTAARHNASAADATAADKQDTFTITVTDNHGGTTTIPVTLTILGANTAPVASKTVGAFINGVLSGTVTATDIDSDTIAFSRGLDPASGSVTVDPTTGTWAYKASAPARAAAAATPEVDTDTFTIVAWDGHGGNTPVTINVEVMPTQVLSDIPVSSAGANSSVVSPDGSRIIASTVDYDPATGYSTRYRLLDTSTGQQIGTPVTLAGSAKLTTFTQDNKAIIAIAESYSSADGYRTSVAVINLTDSSLQGSIGTVVGSQAQVSFDPEPGKVVVRTSAGTDRSGVVVVTPSRTTSTVVDGLGALTAVSPDGTRILITSYSNQEQKSRIAVVNAMTGAVLGSNELTATTTGTAFFTLDGSRAIVPISNWNYTSQADYFGGVAVVDTATGHLVATPVTAVGLAWSQTMLSPDNSKVVFAVKDVSQPGGIITRVAIIDTATGAVVGGTPTVVAGFTRGSVAFSLDGTRVFQVTEGNSNTGPTLYVLNASTGAVLSTAVLGGFSVYSGLVVSPDRSRGFVALETYDPGVTVSVTKVLQVDMTTGQVIGAAPFVVGKPEGYEFSPDGARFVVFSRYTSNDTLFGRVSVYDSATGALMGTTIAFFGDEQADGWIDDLIFTADGSVTLVHTAFSIAHPEGVTRGAVVDVNNAARLGIFSVVGTVGPSSGQAGKGIYWFSNDYNGDGTYSSEATLVNTGNGRVTRVPAVGYMLPPLLNSDGSGAAVAVYAYDSATKRYTTRVLNVDTTTGNVLSSTVIEGKAPATPYFVGSALRASVQTETGVRTWDLSGSPQITA